MRRLTAISALLIVACGKSAPNASAPDGSRIAVDSIDAGPPRDPAIEPLWTRARETSEADDLARLADREGEAGLVARAQSDPAMRLTAIRAIAFAPEPRIFDALPFLAREATEASDEEANAALDSAIDLAARARRAVDPEDGAELKEGCERLAMIASGADGGAPTAPRARRVKAIRVLRMLMGAPDPRCDPKDLPADLDAR